MQRILETGLKPSSFGAYSNGELRLEMQRILETGLKHDTSPLLDESPHWKCSESWKRD